MPFAGCLFPLGSDPQADVRALHGGQADDGSQHELAGWCRGVDRVVDGGQDPAGALDDVPQPRQVLVATAHPVDLERGQGVDVPAVQVVQRPLELGADDLLVGAQALVGVGADELGVGVAGGDEGAAGVLLAFQGGLGPQLVPLIPGDVAEPAVDPPPHEDEYNSEW